ncbi:MerR family transcriptional regulator [Halopolyspora algeriensis]|uniref:MerR family transcriptional regulator n=1 Tax=Halopolyspora algeriensis TaxID=1500506 RepID=UPI003B83924B
MAGAATAAAAEDVDVSDDREPPKLTVAAVARRLGVAPATLRTWDRRYGIGPSDHTAGHHRRYGPGDIARLEQMQRALLRGASPAEAARYARTATPAQQPSSSAEASILEEPRQSPSGHEPVLSSGVLGSADDETEETFHAGGGGLKLGSADPRARGLGRAALSLDSQSAQQLLAEGMQADGVVATWHDMLWPVLRALTERRQRSGTGIEAVRLLTDCASTAFRVVIANAPLPINPRPVVLAPVPGEGQELELVALAAALATSRVGHRLFGAPLPKEGLDNAVRRAAPAAVVLWAQQPYDAAPHLISDLPSPRQRVRAFAAGPGWDAEAMPARVEVLDSLPVAVKRVSETVLGAETGD